VQVQLCCWLCCAPESAGVFTAHTGRQAFGRAIYSDPQLPCISVDQSPSHACLSGFEPHVLKTRAACTWSAWMWNIQTSLSISRFSDIYPHLCIIKIVSTSFVPAENMFDGHRSAYQYCRKATDALHALLDYDETTEADAFLPIV